MTTTDPPPQCTAISNSTGQRCRKRPIVGGTVCPTHGGSAPQVRAAAERRTTEAAADKLQADLWPGLVAANAVKDPVDLLARTAGAVEQMAEVVGARVNELHGRVGAGEHLTQLRAEVVLLDRLLDKLLKAGEGMARLGLAERHVELEQAKAQLVVAAFLAALEVGGLLPDQRNDMLAVFLGQLGHGDVLELAGGSDD